MASAPKWKLVIVESPAKARTIGKFLGKGYKVEASNGHVRDLPKSQIGVDVENDFEPKYITIRGRGEVLEKIRKEARNASRIILATDPDREGEAISWHLANILKMDGATPCRVEFHEITSKAVQAAIKTPRPINMSLVNAQQARRVLDRLVGYKISPLLWVKVKKGLSAGRVQSVATRMIVDRENEIDAFEPEEYWDILAQMQCDGQTFRARFVSLDGQKKTVDSAASAEEAARRIRAAQFTVAAVRAGERRKNPAAPFTTSNLQQEAARKLRFTTAKTMQIAQQLYEGVDIAGEGTQGLISYIRTDSVRVSEEAIAAVRDVIADRYGAAYLPPEPNRYKGRKDAQDAHEAIRPTDVTRAPETIKESLSKDQYNLYRLIYLRFLSSQMMPAAYDTLSVDLAGDGVALRFSGEQKRFPGFTAVYEEGSDEEVQSAETQLPKLQTGDTAKLIKVEPEQHFTQPPPRYTEASLVRALEEKGIGRPSTYAPTITTILARGYVYREKQRLTPTELGRMVTDMMMQYFADIVDITFTASMEEELDRVEEDTLPWKDVIRQFYGPFAQTLEVAEREIEKIEVKDEVSDVQCEKCGAMMVYKMGRYGKFLACPNFPDCRNTKALQKEIPVPCPRCGGKILEKMSRKGKMFYGCERYPECDFLSWDLPVEERCPECGGYMVFKATRKGERFHVCANEACKHRILLPDEEETALPEDET